MLLAQLWPEHGEVHSSRLSWNSNQFLHRIPVIQHVMRTPVVVGYGGKGINFKDMISVARTFCGV
jgi:hypothetical protein